MKPSTPVSVAESYVVRTPTKTPVKQLVPPTSIIHSTRVRQSIFLANPGMGKLRNAALRNGVLSPPRAHSLEKNSQSTRTENWRKNLVVDLDEESLGKELRDYLGIPQTTKANTLDLNPRALNFPTRTRSSGSTKTQIISRRSAEMFKGQAYGENLLVKDLMRSIEETHTRNFSYDLMGEKYQFVTFVKAPSKEYVKLLKLSSYDVTLVPSDSRRTIIEAMLRDYFLDLIPENSDFLICKNSQTNIYTILFTGRLVPVCKVCSLVSRFELSKDLGFEIVCSSLHCTRKILHRSKLSNKTIEYLWPMSIKPDVEKSLALKEPPRRPIISKIIQSGKYKRADFSRVLDSTPSPTRSSHLMRTDTTVTFMNNSGSGRSRIIIRGNFPSKSPKSMELQRCNTNESLKTLGLRPSNPGSPLFKNFRGMPVLKELEDNGLFAKESENSKVMEEASEETERYEEVGPVVGNRLLKIEEEKSTGITKFSLMHKKIVDLSELDRLAAYTVKLDRKTLFKDEESSSNLDDSFEDIHNMVNLLNKEPQKKGY